MISPEPQHQSHVRYSRRYQWVIGTSFLRVAELYNSIEESERPEALRVLCELGREMRVLRALRLLDRRN